MSHFRWKLLVSMVTIATNLMATMAKLALIKRVSIWLYEYDIPSVMDGVHLIEIFEHPIYVFRTQIRH